MEESIRIRGLENGDRPFIYSSMLKGLYYGDSWFSRVDKNAFMNAYAKVISRMLDSSHVVVRVACLPDDPAVILGYALLSGNSILHWVYVKKDWRKKFGIAKLLVPHPVSVATHLNSEGAKYAELKGIKFNPFMI